MMVDRVQCVSFPRGMFFGSKKYSVWAILNIHQLYGRGIGDIAYLFTHPEIMAPISNWPLIKSALWLIKGRELGKLGKAGSPSVRFGTITKPFFILLFDTLNLVFLKWSSDKNTIES